MPEYNQREIEKLRALVRKNQESVEILREMVEHLLPLVAALKKKDRQRIAKGPQPKKKTPKEK